MNSRLPSSLRWPEALAALRACRGERVIIRDGADTAPAALVRTRPAAKGTELCLFPGETPIARTELIALLETLSRGTDRRFRNSARACINDAYLLIEGVADEDDGGVTTTAIVTRRPTLGFNRSLQAGDRSHLRSKRIKNR